MVSPMDYFRKRLFAGILPANKNEFAGTIPVNKNEIDGTVPANKNKWAGTVPEVPVPHNFFFANARVSTHDDLGGRVAGRDIVLHPGI